MLTKNVHFLAGFLLLVLCFQNLEAQILVQNDEQNSREKISRNVVYFAPEIFPPVEEIRSATYDAFFSAVTDRFANAKNSRMVRVDMPVTYQDTDAEVIREICLNNDASHAVIPKVRFFKVGLGQFVFSSQVIVSMKLYDARGVLIAENKYDTFRKNARILGSAQNSIKKGTDGVMKLMSKDLKRARKTN
ncbi:pyruvate decarboxylase [Chryseobacterium sp. MFBS3-17]|uniref:pyruvate decarboxylase n=1 Tax=Chryseobacterium sp. MFBS3-17 TaxID=2886689 RepID=UPI001D0E9E79|nr:pyruvate decarboxylase [Chryseobacterium sp. MFBS3-17]MCC2591418.1 pyruvate decarboxylase [Chryseobacterium sp. MFBS3-17]